jgi:hypothetical protein
MSRLDQQRRAMIDALRAHLGAVPLQIGVLPRIGRPDEGAMRARDLWPLTDPGRLLAWAAALQVRESAQVYVRPLPTAAHPWLFVDDVSSARALAFAAKRAALVVQTSRGNCQLRILADRPMDCAERTAAQRVLRARLDGDPGSVSGEKWGRLAGYKNVKPGADSWTNLALATIALQPVDAGRLLDLAGSASALPSPPAAPGGGGECAPAPGPDARSRAVGKGRRSADPAAGGTIDRSARHHWIACRALRAGQAPEAVAALVAHEALADGKRISETEVAEYAWATVEAAVRAVRR